MIPKKELERLIPYYKGELTENAQLNKAARLAAQKNLWLKSGLPAPLVNAKIKPMGRELTKLTKRIRQGPMVGPGAPPKEEETRLVAGPMEQWVKKIIKGTPQTPKPSIPTQKTKGTKPQRLLPTRPDTTNPKPKKRKRQTEVEKLQPRPGWEEWGAGRKLRRQLEYDDSP